MIKTKKNNSINKVLKTDKKIKKAIQYNMF